MKYFSASIVCMVVLATFRTTVFAEDDTNETVVAVLPGDGNYKPSEAVVAKLEVALSKENGVVLVERAQIGKILREHALAAGSLAAGDLIKLGQLLSADLILFVDKVPKAEEPACRIRVVEARTGILLESGMWEQKLLLEETSSVSLSIQRALAKRQTPVPDRHFLGVLGFQSEESGHLLDGLVDALGFLVITELSQLPGIVFLEREHLEHLRAEKNLTALEQEIRTSASLLETGIRRLPGEEKLTATIMLRQLKGGPPATVTISIPSNDIKAAQREVTKAVTKLLNLKTSQEAPVDPKAEAAYFATQASLLAAWGAPDKALRAAEAAYALNPTQENRFLLARTLRGQPSLPNALRSQQLLLEYYDVHLKALKKGNIKGNLSNLTLPSLGYAHYGPPSSTDDAETAELKREILIAEEELFRRQLAHYREYYDELWNKNFNGSAYWQTWRDRMSSVTRSGSLERQAALIREAADAFCNPPTSVYSGMSIERVAMLASLPRNISGSDDKSKEFFAGFFSELTQHRDPYVRLVAHVAKVYLGQDAAASMQAVFDILLKEITPDHPYRNYWAAETEILAEAIPTRYQYFSQFARKALPAEQFNDNCARLIQAVIDAGKDSHLLAMDVVAHQWLDQIAADGKPALADSLADQMMQLLVKIFSEMPGWAQRMHQELGDQRKAYAKLLGQSLAESKNDPAWNSYQITRLNLDPALKPPHRVLVEDDRIFYVSTIVHDASGFIIKLTVYSLPLDQPIQTLTMDVASMRQISQKKFDTLNGLALCQRRLFVATYQGLAVFSLADGKTALLTEKEGLSGNAILALASFEDKLYLALGGWEAGETACLAVYNPDNRTFNIIASERAVAIQSGLDRQPFRIELIIADNEEKCLWLIDTTSNWTETRGLWKYTPSTGAFIYCHKPKPKPDDLAKFLRAAEPGSAYLMVTAKNYSIDGPGLTLRADQSRPTRDEDGNSVCIVSVWRPPPSHPFGHYFRSYDDTHRYPYYLCLYTNNNPYAILAATQDGKPFPSVRIFQETRHGIFVLCGDGEAYLIKRKKQPTDGSQ